MTDTAPMAVAANPATGELIDLAHSTTTDLAVALDELAGLYDRLAAFRQAIVDEVARRLDMENARSARVGEWDLKTNAPTVEVYNVDALRAELEALVQAGRLGVGVVDRVIETPPPAEPEPRVVKREANKLARHPDRAVVEALERARRVDPQRRTVKVERVNGGPA